MRDFASYDNDVANTWKFRTVAFVLLAAAIPCWPVTAPIFLVFAWLSYKAGMPATAARSNAGRKRRYADRKAGPSKTLWGALWRSLDSTETEDESPRTSFAYFDSGGVPTIYSDGTPY